MSERYGGVKLPKIKVVDLRDSHKRKLIKGDFSQDLISSISNTLDQGKQIILFQNRRGYAPVLECLTCGHMPSCIQCDVTLTHHINSGKLQCHYCGYSIPIPKACCSCSSTKLSTKGSGTQQIEKQLEEFFPNVTIGRMDWDTTRGKNDFDRIIELFSQQKIKILVGTQMIIKGLDFKNVHLVGVLNADHLINFPDLRFISNISVFPFLAILKIIFLPSGENLGAKVIPGKSPRTFWKPVLRSSKKTLGAPL